jgi:hypothetical protein
MVAENLKRDEIMSYFIRPGRIISPAAISEINSGKIGPHVTAASSHELASYIEARVNEPPPAANAEISGENSPINLRSKLSNFLMPQYLFENSDIELKESLPNTKDGIGKIIKAMVAFANSGGGVIYFGVSDDRRIVGILNTVEEQEALRSIGDKCRELICPAINWNRVVFHMNSSLLAAICIERSNSKPVMVMTDFTNDVKAGDIYFRYSGQSSKIRPGDLMKLLAERDLEVLNKMRAGEAVPSPVGAAAR